MSDRFRKATPGGSSQAVGRLALVAVVCAILACQDKGGNYSGLHEEDSQPSAKGGRHLPPWQIRVNKVVLAPNGKQALLGYELFFPQGLKFKDWVKLWDVETGKVLCAFEGLTGTPSLLAFLENGAVAVVGDPAGLIQTYQTPSGKLLRSVRVDSGFLGDAVLSPDGRFALTLGTDFDPKGPDTQAGESKLRVWNLAQEKLVLTAASGVKWAWPYAISPDHRLAVAYCNPGGKTPQLVIMEIKTGKILNRLLLADGWGGPVQFRSDSKQALLGYSADSTTCSVVLCEIETNKVIWKSPTTMRAGRFLQGENLVFAVGVENTWHKLDGATGKLLRSVQLYFGEVPNAYGAPTHKIAPSSWDVSNDGTVLLCAINQNCRGEAPDLTVQSWHLGRRVGLIKSFPDRTMPDSP
jgi:WD40 repeat protein